MSNLATPKFLAYRISWRLVAAEVNRNRVKPYAPQYIHEVAKGYRTNKKLFHFLTLMGVIHQLRQIQQEAV